MGPVVKRLEAPMNTEDDYSTYSGTGPHWVCNPDAKAVIRYAKGGPACLEENPAKTLMYWLQEAAKKHGNQPAFKVERPCPQLVDGKAPPALPEADWMTWSYAQFLDEVQSAAKGFIKLGLQPHEAVNVWGFNSPEWIIAANAAIWAGGKVAGLYPTDTDDAVAYKVAHSGGAIVVVEDQAKIAKLVKGLEARADTCPAKKIKAFVAYGYEPTPGEKVNVPVVGEVPVISWRELIETGKALPDSEMNDRNAATDPGHCACLIYTSGTTGDPKAVMISHDNIAFEAGAMLGIMRQDCGLGVDAVQARILSYLPLSHVAGMMIDIVSPVVSSCQSPGWTTVYFARNYDLKVGAIKDRLQVARPTMFLGVPLVWEKIADKIRAIGAANTGAKKALGDWAKGLALDNSRSKQLGTPLKEGMGLSLSLKILGKVKEGLGLHECKYCLTGAAPIRVDTLEYFGSLGMTISELYGMSECTGACTVSTPAAHLWGSCGYELPGIQVRSFRVDESDFNKKTNCPARASWPILPRRAKANCVTVVGTS